MSQENVEVLQGAIEAWNAGNMNGLRELFDPGAIIVRGLDGWPEGGEPSVGREAVIRLFEGLREAWIADIFETVGDPIDVGDRVVVRQVWRGVGRGPESTMEFTVVYTFRTGKVFLMEYFWDHAEALGALGLSE